MYVCILIVLNMLWLIVRTSTNNNSGMICTYLKFVNCIVSFRTYLQTICLFSRLKYFQFKSLSFKIAVFIVIKFAHKIC